MFISVRNPYIKHLLYAWKILVNFLMYLFRWRKGGGGLHMHLYVWEHIAFPTEQIDGCFTKLGRDEVIMALHMCLGFLARSAKRWIQGSTKIGHWGASSPKDLYFRMQQQQTECNLVSWIEISWLFAFGLISQIICSHAFWLIICLEILLLTEVLIVLRWAISAPWGSCLIERMYFESLPVYTH